MDSTTSLASKIQTIKEIFDIDEIINRPAERPEQIARYYRFNKLTYHFLNSRQGFVHFGLSKNGKFKTSDMQEQARIVGSYIDKSNAKAVLELGAGKAANLIHLAKRFRDVNFTGLDLPNGQMGGNKSLANLSLVHGDYHDLSGMPKDSFDIIFMVETICYARSKQQVANEVQRVLKPGGYFIVFDGFTSKPLSQMNETERVATELVLKSMMITSKNQTYEDFNICLKNSGLIKKESRVLNSEIMPSLLRLQKKAATFFNHPRIFAWFKTVIPTVVTANSIAAYLMPHTFSSGLHQYIMMVAQKPKI